MAVCRCGRAATLASNRARPTLKVELGDEPSQRRIVIALGRVM